MQLVLNFCGEHNRKFRMIKARGGFARTSFYHRPPCNHDYYFVWQCEDCLALFAMSKEEVLLNKDKLSEDININKILTPEQHDIVYGENPTKEEIQSVLDIIYEGV